MIKGEDEKVEQDVTGNGEMYEIENEDSIPMERNENTMEYPREGFGKIYLFKYVPLKPYVINTIT